MGCPKLQINDYFYRTDGSTSLTSGSESLYTPKNAYSDFLNVFSFPGEDALLSETNASGTYLAMTDGNRNIMAYIDASNDTVVASYEYSPFGKLIAKSGSMADDFNFKFSSYFTDDESGLVYYGYRYYDADMGRWINRDPIGESGGVNLYAMCGNNSINVVDRLGMFPFVLPIGNLDLMIREYTRLFKDLKAKISEAKHDGESYYLGIRDKYYCCCESVATGKMVRVETLDGYFPTCVHPDAGYQIAHCMVGVAMRKKGVPILAQTATNYGYEIIRTFWPGHSATGRKPWNFWQGYGDSIYAWLIDTILDIEALDAGYTFNEYEDCIPSDCSKKQ